jgi:hypothetical protein
MARRRPRADCPQRTSSSWPPPWPTSGRRRRPARWRREVRRDSIPLQVEPAPDILLETLDARRDGTAVMVGFALQTGDGRTAPGQAARQGARHDRPQSRRRARRRLRRGHQPRRHHGPGGEEPRCPLHGKDAVAEALLDRIAPCWRRVSERASPAPRPLPAPARRARRGRGVPGPHDRTRGRRHPGRPRLRPRRQSPGARPSGRNAPRQAHRLQPPQARGPRAHGRTPGRAHAGRTAGRQAAAGRHPGRARRRPAVRFAACTRPDQRGVRRGRSAPRTWWWSARRRGRRRTARGGPSSAGREAAGPAPDDRRFSPGKGLYLQRAEVPAAEQPESAADEVSACTTSFLHAQLDAIRRRCCWRWASSRRRRCCRVRKASGACAALSTRTAATPLIVTYHPAYLLRSPQMTRVAWQDFQLLRKVLHEQA